MSGDVLAVFSLLFSTALALALGALSTHGWTRRGLLIGTGGFLIATIYWAFFREAAPTVLPVIQSVATSGAYVPPLVVGLVVLLLRDRERRLAALFRDELDAQPKPSVIMMGEDPMATLAGGLKSPDGMPDTLLVQAFLYVSRSAWAKRNGTKGADVLKEMGDKLHLRKISAWGRDEPDGSLRMIPWNMWGAMRLNPGMKGAQMLSGEPVFYDVQFDMKQVRSVWPPPPPPRID